MAIGGIEPVGFSPGAFPVSGVSGRANVGQTGAVNRAPETAPRFDTQDRVTVSDEAREAANARRDADNTNTPARPDNTRNGTYGMDRAQWQRAVMTAAQSSESSSAATSTSNHPAADVGPTRM